MTYQTSKIKIMNKRNPLPTKNFRRIRKEAIIIRRKIYELSKSYMFICLANLNMARAEDDKEALIKNFLIPKGFFQKGSGCSRIYGTLD